MNTEEEQIRTELDRLCRQGHSEARAIETVAMDLNLSLDDCLSVIAGTDLEAQITDHWTLEFPAVGPPAMRRERRWPAGPQ